MNELRPFSVGIYRTIPSSREPRPDQFRRSLKSYMSKYVDFMFTSRHNLFS